MNNDYIKREFKNGEIGIRPFISLSNTISCVNTIVDLVFKEDEYVPAIYDYVYWQNILSYFTDYNTKVSPDELLEVLYTTNLKGVVLATISDEQREAIDSAVREAIENRVNKSELDLLLRDVRYMIKRYEKVIDKVATPKNLKALFNTLTEKIGSVDFANVLSQHNAKDVKQ